MTRADWPAEEGGSLGGWAGALPMGPLGLPLIRLASGPF